MQDFTKLYKDKSRYKGLFGKGLIALADQTLASGTNFLTSVLLARTQTADEFGSYVLIFSVILLIQSFQSAMITVPMATIGSPLQGLDARNYFGALWRFQILLAIASAIMTCLVSPLFFDEEQYFFTLSLTLVISSWQTQDFLRRVLLTKMRLVSALLNDLLSYGLQVLFIILFFSIGTLTLLKTLLIMGSTSLLATLAGIFQCRDYFVTSTSAIEVFKKNLAFAKWLLGSTALTWTSAHAFNYITAFVIGIKGPAILQACYNLVGPLNIILNGMENIAPQMAARRHRSGGALTLRSFVTRLTAIILLLVITYCLAIGIFSKLLFGLMYDTKYMEYSSIIWIIGATCVVASLMRTASVGLKTLLKTKGIFYAYVASTITTILLGVPLVKLFGITGAVLGSFFSAGTTAAIVLYCYISNITKATTSIVNEFR